MEHRWGDRRPVWVPVRIIGPHRLCASGWLTDISSSGGFVRTLGTLTSLSRITIQALGPRGGAQDAPLQWRGRVVRQGAGGVGIEWEEFAAWHPLASIARSLPGLSP